MYTVILAILTNYSAADAVPAELLAKAIVQESNRANVPAELVARIIILESRGRAKAFNSYTRDYGLMQINEKTARALNQNETCLWDWRCNLRLGVQLLATYDRVCRYNVGTGVLQGRRLSNCLAYEAKLNAFDLRTADTVF